MSLVGFRARNHPQQVGRRRALDEVDDREIAPEAFESLNQRFDFTLDVAAAAHNAKCKRFFDRHTDGRSQSWAGEVVWCNPPFSDIAPWVAKAWTEHRRAKAIVMLVPANRTEQGWWQDLVEPYRDRQSSRLRTEFLRSRLRFRRPGEPPVGTGRPPFGCCLLIWQSRWLAGPGVAPADPAEPGRGQLRFRYGGARSRSPPRRERSSSTAPNRKEPSP